MSTCEMCEDRPAIYEKSKLCNRCYCWIYVKSKRTVTQNMTYIKRVDLASNRVAKYFGKRKHLRRVK